MPEFLPEQPPDWLLPESLRPASLTAGVHQRVRIAATTGTNNLATTAPVSRLGNGDAEHGLLGLNVPHLHRNMFEALLEVGVEAPPHGRLHQAFPADPQDLCGSARSDWHPPPPSEPAHHQVVVKICGCRPDDMTTKSISELRPRVSWCQEHIWTPLCLNMVLAMDNP
ncbi:hypothetical protein ATANTOWER_019880 [Ataeniobius toweri]|uniref:Uncharacterized protein n=1 Tax=Ataeniobius toweri TaxID=208326 RepID=A0ABU7A793_9TELE|nr:hypothetical protein [Ataeniobius toweri]